MKIKSSRKKTNVLVVEPQAQPVIIKEEPVVKTTKRKKYVEPDPVFEESETKWNFDEE